MNITQAKQLRAIGDLSLLRRISLCLIIAGGLLAAPTTFAAEAPKLGDLRGVSSASFNHDGSRVVVRWGPGDVGIWEVPAGTQVAGDLEPNTASGEYLMSPDAKRVLVGLTEARARVFDAATAKASSPILDAPLVSDVQMPALFSPDGNTVLIFGEKEVVVFDAPSGKRAATLPLPAGPHEQTPGGSAAFATGGAQCFVMDGAGTVTRYDAREWKPVGKPMTHPAESADDFSFNISEDGKSLATSDIPRER